VLKEHPAIADAVAVGVPDEKFGEAITAMVEPLPGATVDEADVIAHVKAHLAHYKAPKRVVVIDTIGDRRDRDDIVLVAQSLGGYTAPLVADRLAARLIVMVAAMVPVPGESAGEYWAATGAEQARIDLARADGRNPDDMDAMFLHDVPEAVVLDGQAHLRNQSGTPFEAPFPLAAWPDVPTRFLLCSDDRFFPADLLRRIVPERLGITPDEMEGGHLPALAHPDELARRLHDYADGR